MKGIENPNEYLQELDSQNNPEDFYFNCYNNDYDNQRIVIQKHWGLMFDAYRTELDLIYKNTKLEAMYCDIASKALNKCVEYGKKEDFKKMCENIKTHLSHNIRTFEKNWGGYNNSPVFALNIKNSDTNERLLKLRFEQLQLAKGFELW